MTEPDTYRTITIVISEELYAAITQDGIANERTPEETIRWGMRQYLRLFHKRTSVNPAIYIEKEKPEEDSRPFLFETDKGNL
jgi:hypothetical protein